MKALQFDIMKALLSHCVGSPEPFYIKKKNDEVVVTFIRGFADADRNIVLISEKPTSTGMNFIEIKNIREITPWTQSASLRHLKQELSILMLFFQCIFIYKGNLVSRLHYAKRVVSGNLSFLLATCAS